MSYDPCPHGREPSTCEQCPRVDLSAVLDREMERRRAASAPPIVGPRVPQAEGPGGAKTARERAIEALSPHAFERAACEKALDDLEAAGLAIVDAEENDRDQRLLRESIDALAAGPTIAVLGGEGL